MNRSTFIATTGVFTALVAVTTAFFTFAMPKTQGYINFGDAIIFITGIFFGPIPAMIAGGVGSALADVLIGYVIWAPFTLVIKASEGFIVGLLSAVLCKIIKKKFHIISYIVAMVAAGAVMILGYFFATWILYGLAVAVISLGESAIQIGVSIIIALVLLGVSKSLIIAINKRKI